ncbi:hypothetical protein F5Y15DRAFT_373112 [Xylariaceae sp. FL0016]|nr:hypothetical protein F5Y15DRAFT_373112 [Xylariaceae sp. FL0016]
MKFSATASATLFMAGATYAAPTLITPRDTTAADLIAQVAPKSVSCSNTDQCRTNVQAAPHFIQAFSDYKLNSPGQIAAVLALTAFESDDYAYKIHIDGNAGQGTSNMQSPDFNVKYANSIPELKTKLDAIGTLDSDDKKLQMLDLVIDDKYNFASGAWFLTTQCPQSTVDALAKGDDAGFNTYMECVGVTMTDARSEYWNRAKTAFNL